MERPAQWVKADPGSGTGAYQSESKEEQGQREDPTDFQRGKHDSFEGSGVRMASDSSIAMMKARREGSYALKFQKERAFHSGVPHPANIN